MCPKCTTNVNTCSIWVIRTTISDYHMNTYNIQYDHIIEQYSSYIILLLKIICTYQVKIHVAKLVKLLAMTSLQKSSCIFVHVAKFIKIMSFSSLMPLRQIIFDRHAQRLCLLAFPGNNKKQTYGDFVMLIRESIKCYL